MISCKDCKWWIVHRRQEAKGLWGKCAMSISKHGEPNHTTMMVAQDDATKGAYANTHRTFACIMGETISGEKNAER